MAKYPVSIGEQNTLQVPHKRCTIDGETFYVAQYPEGDYCIHVSARYSGGYDNAHIQFLMEDGSIHSVQGPYRIGGSVTITAEKSVAIANALGIDPEEFQRHATRLVVGSKLFMTLLKDKQIVHEESAYSLQPIHERLKPEWWHLEVAIYHREVTLYRKVCDILKAAEKQEIKSDG